MDIFSPRYTSADENLPVGQGFVFTASFLKRNNNKKILLVVSF
jgi:hypothetical protein